MITELPQQRITVIDGNKCLESVLKKVHLYARRSNLELKKLKDFINLTYHFFIVETLKIKKPLSLKFNCTIVFYVSEIQSQLKNEKAFKSLVDLLKRTSPIPVFIMDRRNDKDLPFAAENCINKHKGNLRSFNKHIFTNNLNALKNMYKSQIVIKGLEEEE